MNTNKVFQSALASTPYPVTQRPVVGKEPVYLTFFEILGRPDAYASNQPRRIEHTYQVDIFSRMPAGPEIEIVFAALKRAGIRVTSWGPVDYETDTKWHHLPITCKYAEVITEQEE